MEGFFSKIISHEPQIRLLVFLGIFLLTLIMEFALPHREFEFRTRRWSINLGLAFLNTLCLRVVFPVLAIDVAIWAKTHQFGLLNLLLWGEAGLSRVFLDVLLMDFFIFVQHYVFHRIDFFWRLHRVHHLDLGFDVTTGVRFHPLEIILSMGIKMFAVALIGVSPIGILIFEIILSASSLWSHGNFRLPKRLDLLLKYLIVTPSMHRIHHSAKKFETDSCFGFNLSIWDRLFRTYRSEPQMGYERMKFGLSQFRQTSDQTFFATLWNPFRRN